MGYRDIVVIGASLGGVDALLEIARRLPADFDAAVFAVLHIGAHRSNLPGLLNRTGPLQAMHAHDGQIPVKGRIYVAPPDHHLLLQEGKIRVIRGPKEHHTRPAIDPLFRSAALAYGPRTIGVVLTGHLDDGTAGLQAIKECGGIAVVQDPEDARARGMPDSALANVQVDHCARLDAIPDLLVSLVASPAALPVAAPPARLVHEHMASIPGEHVMHNLEAIANPSALVCPECTGTLLEVTGAHPPRYRCHTGHAYSIESLRYTQAKGVEAALWSAMRALQDLEVVLRKKVEHERSRGITAESIEMHQAEADEVAARAAMLRRLISGVES